MVTSQIVELARRLAGAIASTDRATARECCTPSGRLFGETPAALFLDAIEHGYQLEVAGEARVVGERGAVPAAVVKDGYAARQVWLLAEVEDGEVGLAGVTGSSRVVEAFLCGIVPANAALRALPQSARGERFGAGIAQAFARHGKVGDAFGAATIAATAAGWMLDSMLASPGAQIEVAETRELTGAKLAAVRFEVSRPELSLPEDFWVVLELAQGHEVVRATASSMSLDVLLSQVEAQAIEAASAPVEAPAFVEPEPDRIDVLLERLRAALESVGPEAEGAGIAAASAPGSPLEREVRERVAHDPEAAEALRALLDEIAGHLPKRAPEEDLRAWVQRLLDELVAGLGRTIGERSEP